MQIPVGVLLDKFSPRYLTALAILTCAIATLIFAESNSLVLACFSRALIGFGAAFAAVSCFKLATVWFPPQRFALVSGMCMTAAMLGAIGGQAPLSFLVQNFAWRAALEIIGCGGMVLSLLYVLVVRDKRSTIPTVHSGKLLNNFLLILSNKQAWLLSLYSGFAFAPVSVFGGLWGVPFLQQAHHLSASAAAIATSTIFIGFAVGAPLLGWLSDAMGKRKPILFAGTFLALVSLAIVIYYPGQQAGRLSLLLFLFGFGSSGFFTSFAMIREIFPIILAATVLGFMNTFASICEALSEPLLGVFLDFSWQGSVVNGVHQFSTQGYQIALSLLVIYLLIAFCLLGLIKETYCKIKE
jgi:MFS family permease